MKLLRFVLLATVGVILALYLVRYVGWQSVLSAVTAVGFLGFAVFTFCTLLVFVLLGVAWQALLAGADAPRLALLIRARLVRDAGAEVLPLSQLGGIALGVRAAILQGVAAPLAAASMIVDVTTEMLAQIAYAALGVGILAVRVPQTSRVASFVTASVIGLALATIAAALFIAVQRHGGRIAERFGTRLLRGAAAGLTSWASLTSLRTALERIYRSPARVALSAALHLAAWIANGMVVWVGFRMIGARLDLEGALAIESLVYAIRSVAVFIPNALGVQEGAYVILGPLFGVGADMALAMSVLKRARDIAIGVPVLLLWQGAEGRRALARSG
jgi:putative membrane protein